MLLFDIFRDFENRFHVYQSWPKSGFMVFLSVEIFLSTRWLFSRVARAKGIRVLMSVPSSGSASFPVVCVLLLSELRNSNKKSFASASSPLYESHRIFCALLLVFLLYKICFDQAKDKTKKSREKQTNKQTNKQKPVLLLVWSIWKESSTDYRACTSGWRRRAPLLVFSFSVKISNLYLRHDDIKYSNIKYSMFKTERTCVTITKYYSKTTTRPSHRVFITEGKENRCYVAVDLQTICQCAFWC